jgi:hypothetical protein
MGGADSHHCPGAAVLAAFVEGKLDVTRSAVVERHLANCSECVSVAGETSHFLMEGNEEVAEGEADPPSYTVRPLAVAAAAGLAMACLVTMWWVFTSRRDPLLHLREIAGTAPTRMIEPRLAGFPYARFEASRSGAAGQKNPDDLLRAEAERVAALRVSDGRAWHARGVAALLLRNDIKAVRCLENATRAAPRDPAYWNDLAAAEIVRDGGRGDVQVLRLAISSADRALSLAPSLASASFNRAIAAERLGHLQEAIGSYRQALASDPHSGWAAETRSRLRRLFL